ncbi:GlcG/HbpS family heme-binding protein [Xanthobacter sediminis]
MAISRAIGTLTSSAALRAAEAAVACGTARGVAVVTSVVDAGGHLLVALRADGAFVASIDISNDKAWTAVTFGLSTDRLYEAISTREPLREGIALRPGVVLFGGGVPVIVEGQAIGAIGVSGGSEDDDRACAAAGLVALDL